MRPTNAMGGVRVRRLSGARVPRAAAAAVGPGPARLPREPAGARRCRAPARPPQRPGRRRAARPRGARRGRGCSARTAPTRITASTAGPRSSSTACWAGVVSGGRGIDRGQRGRGARAAARARASSRTASWRRPTSRASRASRPACCSWARTGRRSARGRCRVCWRVARCAPDPGRTLRRRVPRPVRGVRARALRSRACCLPPRSAGSTRARPRSSIPRWARRSASSRSKRPSCGTPAVVAGGHGCGEWFGRAGGCVVAPDDAAALAEAVRDAWPNPRWARPRRVPWPRSPGAS